MNRNSLDIDLPSAALTADFFAGAQSAEFEFQSPEAATPPSSTTLNYEKRLVQIGARRASIINTTTSYTSR